MSRPFKTGDTVKLKPEILKHHRCPVGRQNHDQADIRGIAGNHGEVWLDQDLHGCQYWNQEDLILVKAVDDKKPR